MPRKVSRRQQLIRLLSEISAGDVVSTQEMNDIITLKNNLVANTPVETPKKKKGFGIKTSRPINQPAAVPEA